MSNPRLTILMIAGTLLGVTRVQAQQPQRPDSMASGMMDMSGKSMGSPSAADRRLDELMKAMNAAPANRRMAAMTAVINELAAQHKAMRAHTMGMMHGMQPGGMMRPGDSAGAGPGPRPPAKPEPLKPPPDSGAHEQHH